MREFLKEMGYTVRPNGSESYETYFKRHNPYKFIHVMIWHDGEMDLVLFVWDEEEEDWTTPKRVVTEFEDTAKDFIKEYDV